MSSTETEVSWTGRLALLAGYVLNRLHGWFSSQRLHSYVRSLTDHRALRLPAPTTWMGERCASLGESQSQFGWARDCYG
jgi:hypothetical protein